MEAIIFHTTGEAEAIILYIIDQENIKKKFLIIDGSKEEKNKRLFKLFINENNILYKKVNNRYALFFEIIRRYVKINKIFLSISNLGKKQNFLLRILFKNILYFRDSITPHINSTFSKDIPNILVEESYQYLYKSNNKILIKDNIKKYINIVSKNQENEKFDILILTKYTKNNLEIDLNKLVNILKNKYPNLNIGIIRHPRQSCDKIKNELKNYYLSYINNVKIIVGFHTSIAWVIRNYFPNIIYIDVFNSNNFIGTIKNESRWKDIATYSVSDINELEIIIQNINVHR